MSIEMQILQGFEDHARVHNTRKFVVAYDEWDKTYGLSLGAFANVLKELQIMGHIHLENNSLGGVWLLTIL